MHFKNFQIIILDINQKEKQYPVFSQLKSHSCQI